MQLPVRLQLHALAIRACTIYALSQKCGLITLTTSDSEVVRAKSLNSCMKSARSGTFTDNMKLPVHRWFRYSAGFSAEWVETVIREFQETSGEKAKVLDPFVGSGTTSLAACSAGVTSKGFDGHPFIARVAKAKNLWHLDEYEFRDACLEIDNEAGKLKPNYSRYNEKNLLGKCYEKETLSDLENLKEAYLASRDSNPVWELVWLNISSILRACSNVGTAQWQYILPNKTKLNVLSAKVAFLSKSEQIAIDMEFAKCTGWINSAQIVEHDFRNKPEVSKSNLMITSPPYPNNYDYADATRLEMMFWGEIEGWGDLKTAVRPTLMRSCSQHSASDKVSLDDYLQHPLLKPIADELIVVTRELEKIRLTKGGKKTYHTMIAAYFSDLATIVKNVRELMSNPSKLCLVIGDSAPYGVYVPAERWLGEIALSLGFTAYRFEKLRDRNIKWKNRTHTVPLHEGRLWIDG